MAVSGALGLLLTDRDKDLGTDPGEELKSMFQLGLAVILEQGLVLFHARAFSPGQEQTMARGFPRPALKMTQKTLFDPGDVLPVKIHDVRGQGRIGRLDSDKADHILEFLVLDVL